MHVLRRHPWLITTGIATTALVTLLVSGMAVHLVDHLVPPRPALPASPEPIPRAATPAPIVPSVPRAAAHTPAPRAAKATTPEEEPTYSLNEDARFGAKMLRLLLDDPYLRMDPDQRSKFLGAVLRAQRAFEAEMESIFEIHDTWEMNRAELAAGKRVGQALRQELATFLSPQQMAILGGLTSLDTFILSFFQSDAIVAAGRQ
jgi:hypothetical protein